MEKFPENAVVRREDNQKWYVAFLVVSRRKLGFDSDEKIEIIDLRMSPDDIVKKVDNAKFLPGYHMNKEHWITICLDGAVSAEEISVMIDNSYELARNKSKG